MDVLKRYGKYKMSDISWLKEIPEHWQNTRLKFLSRITTGNKNTEDRKQNGIYNFYVRSQKIEKIDSYSFEGEGILTAGDGVGVGKVFHYVNERFDFHQRVYLFYNFPSFVNGKYLFYFLRGFLIIDLKLFNAKSTVDSVRLPTLKDFVVPLPPKEEQTTIAHFLDYKLAKINRFIQKKKQLIKLLNEQKAAIINQAVTKGLNYDLNDSMNTMMNKKDQNHSPSKNQKNHSARRMKDSGIEWLGEIPEHWEVRKLKYSVKLNYHKSFDNSESENTKIALENIESKTGRILELSQNVFEGIGTVFKKGDVLFGKLRPYLAKAATPNFEGSCVNEILVLTPENSVWNHEFLKYRILASDFISLVDNSTYGAKMPRASWSFIGSLKLSSPPIDEQVKIVEFIEEQHSDTDLLISKIEKELALTEEYKTVLIAEAVTGKIDVRGYVKTMHALSPTEEIEEEMGIAAEEAEDYHVEEM